MNPDELNTNAQILTNAIRSQEGGDNYSAPGDGGNSWGAYQFGKGAWEKAASLAGIKSPWGKASPTEQNQAADTQIKQWLSEGKTPPQVASMWNAGPGEPNAYTGTFQRDGSPSTVPGKFDVPGYTKRVLNSASALWKAKNADENFGQAAGQAVGTVGNQIGQAASHVGKAVGPAGLAATAGVGAIGAMAAPEVGAGGLLEEIGSGIEGAAGGVGNAIKTGLSDIGLGGLLGGSKSPSTDTPTPSATPSPSAGVLTAAENAPLPQAETKKAPVYGTLQSMLGSMVGGKQVMQEAENRGVDPIAEMVNTGNIPQPDESGILDKETAISGLQDLVKQDKKAQTEMAGTLTAPTNLDDLEMIALSEAEAKMQGSPNLASTKQKIQKTFEDYRSQQPMRTDKKGKQYRSRFVTPQKLQLMKDRATEGVDWSAPYHERKASQHIYNAMKGRLSDVAKIHNVKGWDETNKRMEARILAQKAIKKMPKKAQRDKFKEFKKDMLAALAGGLVSKTLGHGTLPGLIAGHVIERQLNKAEYKKIGSKHELTEAEKRRKMPQKGLLSRPQIVSHNRDQKSTSKQF